MKNINKLSIFTFIYLIFSIILVALNSLKIISLGNYLNLILALIIFVIIKLFSKNEYIRNKDNMNNVKDIIMICVFSLLIYFLLGLIFGYSYNVHNGDFKVIIINFVYYVIPFLFIEYVRFYLIKHSGNNRFIITLITILIILFNINYGTLFSLQGKHLFIYLFSDIFILVMKNITLTVIMLEFGLYSSIAYQFVYTLITLYIPILPALNYFVTFIIFLVMNIFICYKVCDSKEIKYFIVKKENKTPIVLFYVFIIIALCFNFGLFKYKPVAVMSNSMKDTFSRGDMVIYKDIKEELKENDIIIFDHYGVIYIHRINKIVLKNGKTYYVTKGDANNSVDKDMISESEIIGKKVMSIPYMGYPSVFINELLN